MLRITQFFVELVILKIFILKAWNVHQFFFVSNVYFLVKLKHSLIKKVFINWCASIRHNFIFWNKTRNFQGFLVFDFGPYTEIGNSENSEMVSRLVTLIDFLCFFEETGKFRDFRVFDFNLYTEIRNSENFLKYFQGL